VHDWRTHWEVKIRNSETTKKSVSQPSRPNHLGRIWCRWRQGLERPLPSLTSSAMEEFFCSPIGRSWSNSLENTTTARLELSGPGFTVTERKLYRPACRQWFGGLTSSSRMSSICWL